MPPEAPDREPLVTVVMATFNSARLMDRVLEAVRAQDYPQDRIEVLVVDGGSTDGTRQVAERYGARWLDNPRTEPVHAKFLGLHEARGRYITYLDHDEVMRSAGSLRAKVDAFRAAPGVRAVIGSGYANPPGCARINDYINDFGDPFSMFVYRLSKHERFFVRTMQARYPSELQQTGAIVFDFTGVHDLPIIELCAAGSMIDLEFLRERMANVLAEPSNIPHLFYLMLPIAPHLAVTPDDALLHYSSDRFGSYLAKIKWRVKNNVHFPHMAASGFTGRKGFGAASTRRRQLLFPIYSLTLFPAALDGVRLALTRRNAVYLLHPALCVYTTVLIVGHMLLRSLGYRPAMRSYDESTVIASSETGATR